MSGWSSAVLPKLWGGEPLGTSTESTGPPNPNKWPPYTYAVNFFVILCILIHLITVV